MRYAILALLAGCFSPQPVPGAPCAADGTCPSGLVCSADERCLPPGSSIDAPIDSSSDASVDGPTDTMPDAMIDAMTDAGPTTPFLVQQAGGYNATATALTVVFPAAPTVGNMLVAVVGCPSASIATITGGSASWVRAASSTVNANVEVYTGVANGQSSVSIGLPACTSQMSLSLSEWDRIAANPVDVVDGFDGITSPASGGSITTTGSPRLLLFSVANFTPNTVGTPSEGPWSTLTPIVGPVEIRTWYRVVTTTGTFAPTVTETRHEWDATIVALKGE